MKFKIENLLATLLMMLLSPMATLRALATEPLETSVERAGRQDQEKNLSKDWEAKSKGETEKPANAMASPTCWTPSGNGGI